MPETVIPNLTNGQLYGFRMFPRNMRDQFQTEIDMGTAEATPTDRTTVTSLGQVGTYPWGSATDVLGTSAGYAYAVLASGQRNSSRTNNAYAFNEDFVHSNTQALMYYDSYASTSDLPERGFLAYGSYGDSRTDQDVYTVNANLQYQQIVNTRVSGQYTPTLGRCGEYMLFYPNGNGSAIAAITSDLVFSSAGTHGFSRHCASSGGENGCVLASYTDDAIAFTPDLVMTAISPASQNMTNVSQGIANETLYLMTTTGSGYADTWTTDFVKSSNISFPYTAGNSNVPAARRLAEYAAFLGGFGSFGSNSVFVGPDGLTQTSAGTVAEGELAAANVGDSVIYGTGYNPIGGYYYSALAVYTAT